MQYCTSKNAPNHNTDDGALAPMLFVKRRHLRERKIADNVRVEHEEGIIPLPEYVSRKCKGPRCAQRLRFL